MSTTEDRHDEAQFVSYDSGLSVAALADIGLHQAIAELMRSVHTESKAHREGVMERFSSIASTYLGGVDEASVMLLCAKGAIRPATTMGIDPHPIDKIQEDLCEGPSIDAAKRQRVVRVPDLRREARWPRFCESALADTPVRSALCLQLYTQIQNWGAIALYSNRPNGIQPEAEQLGAVLATHASLALNTMQRSRQYRSALGSRDLIGQAKGILMERFEIGANGAFALLTRLSLESNKPVVVIAKDIVESKPLAD